MVNFTDTAITVHWEPLECIDINSQFEITGYTVRYGFGSEPGTSMAFQSSLPIVTIQILTPGFEYFIEVAAVNSNGETGDYSNRIIQTTPGQLLDIDLPIYKNKNISEKMSEYVGFSPPPTYFLHIRCDQ